MDAANIAWDVVLSIASTIFGTALGIVASNPDMLPPILRSRKDEWAGDWWSIWQDTEDSNTWNIDKGAFYKRFGVLKFKTDSSAQPRRWEASGTIDDSWYYGRWKSLRELATARGTFMFRRPTLKGDIAGYFLSPNNNGGLVAIRGFFTRDAEFANQLTAGGAAESAKAFQAFANLIKP